MSGWGVAELAAALPAVDVAPDGDDGTQTPLIHYDSGIPSAGDKKPTEHGWVQKSGYDYNTYNMSSKELADAHASVVSQDNVAAEDTGAVGGVAPGDWASNAATYTWDDEFGDIGPAFPELERQLFGAENHVRAGIEFSNIGKLAVVQEGATRIAPINDFAKAGLHPAMLANVKLAGYQVPTPIQQYTIPAVISNHDIVACAQTGSGKTAAYLIPVLSKLMGKAKKLAAPRPNPASFVVGVSERVRAEPLVLIVAPTRELVTQIFDECRRFCYRTMLRPAVVYGGTPIAEQINQIAKGCDVLIGTPGRLIDFINRTHLLTLKRLKYMIIDEADEMLQADWEAELKQIMSGGDQDEGNITYLMFSATFPKITRELAKEHLRNDHVRIRVGRAGSTHVNIRQDIVYVGRESKRQAIFDLLMSTPPARTMIFVNSKRTADEVDDFLFNLDIPCTSIHGDRTQREREDSLRAFRSGKCPVLIATGVSARGLDVHHVMHVVNYDLPSNQYGGIEEYTHRIGRTGRIGNTGLATSFYNDRDDDMGEVLVKFLLETKQKIPDFLQDKVPEGFVAGEEGIYHGDIELLKFEDSDDEAEGGDNDAVTDTGAASGVWGAAPLQGAPTEPTPAATAGWGAPQAATTPVQVAAPGQEAQPVAAANWGAPQAATTSVQVAAPVQAAQPVAAATWGAPQAATTSVQVAAPVQAAQPVAAATWGAPQAATTPVQVAAPVQAAQPVAGWGVASTVTGPAAKPASGGWGASESFTTGGHW